jgi:CRISPR-associated protein Csm1
MMAAKAVIAENRKNGHRIGNRLIQIQISGIQSFIYEIGSRNALKNLRARSFFVELLLNHVIDQFVMKYKLHPANVIMNGGGSALIMSSIPINFKIVLNQIDIRTNQWLVDKFNGPLALTIAHTSLDDDQLSGNLADCFNALGELIFRNRRMRFSSLIQNDAFEFVKTADPAPERCELCFSDYTAKQKSAPDEVPFYKCPICDRFIRLGSLIPKTRFIYQTNMEGKDCLQIVDSTYRLSEALDDHAPKWVIFKAGQSLLTNLSESSGIMFAEEYAVPNSKLPENMRQKINKQKSEIEDRLAEESDPQERYYLEGELNAYRGEYSATLEILADISQGQKLVGALRMDADNLGRLLIHGFSQGVTLEKAAALSRNMNYLFRIVLNDVCSGRTGKGKRRYVHVVYAGGDDLFALGAWSDIAELADEFSNYFHRYTCNNIDIGISAGFSIHGPKYPVRQMAEDSLAGLNLSKQSHAPCWFCHKQWMDCPFNLDGSCLRKDAVTPFFDRSKLWLKQQLDIDIEQGDSHILEPSRLKLSFKRRHYHKERNSLLDEFRISVLVPLQAMMNISDKVTSRGFLHNMLKLLDVWYADGLLYLPRIAWLLQRHKEHFQRVYLEEAEDNLYELCQYYFHCASPNMLASLHIPLTWILLLQKEGDNRNEA